MYVRKLLLPIFAFTLIVLFNSCKKETVVLQQTAGQEIENYRIMDVAYYRELKGNDGDGIGVRLYQTPVILNLYRSNPDFNTMKALIDESKENHTSLRIYTKDLNELSKITAASAEEEQFAQARKVFAIDPKPDFPLNTMFPNMQMLDSVFHFMQMQGCATSTVSIDQCISFQYVVDGCYARAHKMRQIMDMKYGYGCRKIFSYEGDHGYLAVDAGDCCVYWWYHVAPYVRVLTPEGIKEFVMDPSMFDHVVTADEWTGAQENLSCSPDAEFGHMEITPGYIYAPGGSTDDDYWSTNWTLNAYSDLVTCD